MIDATTSPARAPDDRGATLLAHYRRAGYVRAEPPILQPAEPFLDMSGEDIRRRMYLTTDASGRELCLRPDLTIPVSRDYLASANAGRPAGFCYLGPVFRYRSEASAEFPQAGIESFGRRDTAAADAEMLSLGLEATAHYGIPGPDIRMGDVAVFAALVDALNLAPAWKRRLVKDFNRADSLEHDLDRLVRDAARTRPDYQGVLTALAGSDPRAAHALVTDLLSIAGIDTVGGRSVDEIADRFLEQSAFGAGSGLPQETRELIERFLAISGDPDEAAADLRALAADAGIALDRVLDLFESRTGFLAARGVDVGRIRFSTAFGRRLDYYTGVVFELHDPRDRASDPQGRRQLVAGGRYDGLLTRLGAPSPIPAVGFAVWIDTLIALGGRP
ncbi:MAG TPA: ATP phosphoribosyltransferase regulatory subunit [Xanthobacteraceae bacterium]|nr:ATP phosphoribosyltransferase regulatory subunit [Xanthobacteraceae bacterium]